MTVYVNKYKDALLRCSSDFLASRGAIWICVFRFGDTALSVLVEVVNYVLKYLLGSLPLDFEGGCEAAAVLEGDWLQVNPANLLKPEESLLFAAGFHVLEHNLVDCGILAQVLKGARNVMRGCNLQQLLAIRHHNAHAVVLERVAVHKHFSHAFRFQVHRFNLRAAAGRSRFFRGREMPAS